MSGMAFTTVSPSSSSKIRNTPCVDGCCGPMFNTMVLVIPAAVSTVVIRLGSYVPLAWALGGIISSQWVPFPVVRHHDAPQIRMSGKSHAKKIEYFALQPIRSRPHGHQRIHHCMAAGHAGTQPQTLPSW